MAFAPTNTGASSEELACANARLILSAGHDKQSLVDFYDKWAENGDFDKQIAPGNGGATQLCYQEVKPYIDDQKDAEILDIGGGTGLSAQLFKNDGFTNVDVLDPSEGMLQKAQEKKVYRNYFQNFFTEKNEYLKTNSYDSVISIGAFGASQVQHTALPEVIRVVRSGGYVCIVTRPAYVDAASEMGQGMMRLEREGLWRRLSEKPVPNYVYSVPGVCLLFQVTK